MNDYSKEEEKVIEEKRNFILSIRKRKINFFAEIAIKIFV